MPTSQRLCLRPGWAGLRVWPGFACAAPVGLGNSAGLATPCGVTPVGKLGSCCSHGDWASVALTEPSPGAEAPSSLSCSACATVPLAEVSPMARLRFHSLRALGTEPQAYTGTTCFALASQPSLVAWHWACTHPVASGVCWHFWTEKESARICWSLCICRAWCQTHLQNEQMRVVTPLGF